MVKRQYQAYKSATHTVAKTQQVVMLYDGAIRYIRQAREAIEAKRIEDRYNLLMKAADIISGLQGALDFERGGNIAVVLYNYYSSISSRLFAIHHSNNVKDCDAVIEDLKQMRAIWQQIDSGDTEENQPSPPPATTNPKDDGNRPSGVTLSA